PAGVDLLGHERAGPCPPALRPRVLLAAERLAPVGEAGADASDGVVGPLPAPPAEHLGLQVAAQRAHRAAASRAAASTGWSWPRESTSSSTSALWAGRMKP